MLSYFVYKIVHLVGIFMLFLSLGGMMIQSLSGADRGAPMRKGAAVTHGIGMLLALVGGFGLMARLGIHAGWPGWIYGKLAIWLIFGGLIAVVRRKPELNRALWWIVLALGGAGAYLANYKPF